jgi:hypothetical protein
MATFTITLRAQDSSTGVRGLRLILKRLLRVGAALIASAGSLAIFAALLSVAVKWAKIGVRSRIVTVAPTKGRQRTLLDTELHYRTF